MCVSLFSRDAKKARILAAKTYCLFFQLSDSIELALRTLTRKKRQIVGWSQNLIQNSSGEVQIVYLYYSPHCPSCLANAFQISLAIWTMWAGMKKYNQNQCSASHIGAFSVMFAL